ncbi:MAG: CRISPR-associated protein Cas4 [Blastocatellia bacterium]|nr:CRISPR-associated protein Cas4 [Blastocatellia bacterium]
MNSYILALFFLLLVPGLLLIWISRYFKGGLPAGNLIYEDASASTDEVLYSEELNLCGKPDYIVQERDGDMVPVEVKSGDAPRGDHPYESHLMQLAAYFLLIEGALDCIPSHGLIRYRDRTLRVENTEELRERVLEVIERMRAGLRDGRLHRSHNQPSRCARCSMAESCDERMI